SGPSQAFFRFDHNFAASYTYSGTSSDRQNSRAFLAGSNIMRIAAFLAWVWLAGTAWTAEVESRVLTHYIPQDFLETVVRREGWTEVPLNLKGGVRKGDVIRIWAGGFIDRGNGDQPGENVAGPAGVKVAPSLGDVKKLALSTEAGNAFALLFKTESRINKCLAPGKPLEIKLSMDRERLSIGFNDERGRYHDNHLGKGRRHERHPLWVRIEIVRTTVD